MATRTLAGDDNPAWQWTAGGYRHSGCGGQTEFHEHEKEHALAPKLSLCAVCGTRWSRRFTGALTMHRNAWREEEAMDYGDSD